MFKMVMMPLSCGGTYGRCMNLRQIRAFFLKNMLFLIQMKEFDSLLDHLIKNKGSFEIN
jgi:hypothetical protein